MRLGGFCLRRFNETCSFANDLYRFAYRMCNYTDDQTRTAAGLAATSDLALLVIVRDSFFGGGIVFCNYLDAKFIGESMGKTYFITHVQPGEHYVVSATENTGVAHLNFQAGKHYFLRQGVTMGLWRARTSGFFPMTAEETKKAIRTCTYL